MKRIKTISEYSLRKLRMREHHGKPTDGDILAKGMVIGVFIMFIINLIDILTK
jgi:hypothetical protein